MKDFEKIGYTALDGEQYAYFFNEKDFTLILIPLTLGKRTENYFDVLKDFGINNPQNKWVESILLHSRSCADGTEIIFSVLNNPSTYNGIPQYRVQWYLIVPVGCDYNSIDGIEVTGGDVNYYYSPLHALDRRLQIKTNVQTVSISNKVDTRQCGKFKYNATSDCNISVCSYARFGIYNYDRPISATSEFRLIFDKPQKLDDIVTSHNDILKFFQYICCRRNIQFDSVHCVWKESNNRNKHGELVFYNRLYKVDDDKKKSKAITFDILKENTSSLFEYIHCGNVGFQNLSDSAEERNSYDVSRIVGICTEFEREFGRIYGKDACRSDSYKNIKESIVSMIRNIAEDLHGRDRAYVMKLMKSISKLDDAYASKVAYAMDSNKTILKPIIDIKYDGECVQYKDKIAERLNEIRNNLAHGNLGFRLQPVELTDLNILEILTYVIVLKQFLDDTQVMEAINSLYGLSLRVMKKDSDTN